MEDKKKEQKRTTKKVKINKSGRSVKPEAEKVSFDSYFRMLMSKNVSIRPHHKAPMKKFFKSLGAEEETIEKFDSILKKY